MPDAVSLLAARLQAAFDTVSPGADPVLRPSDRADFQANGALPLGKQLGRPPREVAEQVVVAADLAGICSSVEISGPGFINLTLSDKFISSQAAEVSADPRLGVAVVTTPQTVLIDYSSPNVAKEMHVGHLRTTIIGDSLARVLAFQGHTVLRENHIGDWGTPFGMLIEHLLDVDGAADAESFSVRDLNEFYAAARIQFDSDPDFAERSRRRVVLLQTGDLETMRLWGIFVAESMRHAREVYDMLGVLLTEEDTVGESFYNPLLPVVLDELKAKGLLVENDGAQCVFPEGFTNRQGEPLPLIVRKSDGGYGYPATDLAAVRDRTGRLGAQRLLYVVGAEQSLHLRLVFATAVLAGYLHDISDAVHVGFGMVLGTDGKKLASRAGASDRLVDLLSEGIDRAAAAMKDRDSELSPEQQAAVAQALGIGAVKYADLSTEPMTNYVFDWDRMLAFEGNTGPYLQYAHARIRSIFRRAEADPPPAGTRPRLDEAPERALALQLVRFGEAVVAAAESLSPSKLCTYLFDLATVFTTFYEACRVLVADEDVRTSRLALCDLTARVLEQGLSLLGMEAPAQM
ncbi:MAG TPA: arginine--tRNA ligase [Acidimicrobiales bacterium]|jgi:arginyl-tRNA synthetase|nr:arginine--tRNA ligase [Acidimicrobiales bacterium]